MKSDNDRDLLGRVRGVKKVHGVRGVKFRLTGNMTPRERRNYYWGKLAEYRMMWKIKKERDK